MWIQTGCRGGAGDAKCYKQGKHTHKYKYKYKYDSTKHRNTNTMKVSQRSQGGVDTVGWWHGLGVPNAITRVNTNTNTNTNADIH